MIESSLYEILPAEKLQIALKDMENSGKTNVVGRIDEEEYLFIRLYLDHGKSLSLHYKSLKDIKVGKYMAVKCIKNGNIILKDKVIQGKAIIYDKKTIDIVEDKYVSKDIETIDIEGTIYHLDL